MILSKYLCRCGSAKILFCKTNFIENKNKHFSILTRHTPACEQIKVKKSVLVILSLRNASSGKNDENFVQNCMDKIKNGIYRPLKEYHLKNPGSLAGYFFTRSQTGMLPVIAWTIVLYFLSYPIIGKYNKLLILIPIVHFIKLYYFSGPKTNMTVWETIRCANNIIPALQSEKGLLPDNVRIHVISIVVPNQSVSMGLAIIEDTDNLINIETISNFVNKVSKHCAIPIFIRTTLKLDKSLFEYARDGCDVNKISDKLYYYNLNSKKYEILTPEVHKQIITGDILY